MDLRLALITGIDIPIPECQLILHQPKLNEIAFIGEQDFFAGAQTLCLKKSMLTQDESLLANTSNFQVFMTVMNQKMAVEKKESVIKVLELIFPNYQALFTPRSLILKKEEHMATIDNTNFDTIQLILDQVFCINSTGTDQQVNFNPQGKQAQEIANKLMRARQRVAEQKGSSQNSVFTQYISILTVGLQSMSMHDLSNLTMFQLYDLIERYSLWLNWDIDLKSRLAGGKPDSRPDNWMKNIH